MEFLLLSKWVIKVNIVKIFDNIKKYRDNQEDIDIEELRQILNTNPNTILLVVRSPQEYKEGHLSGATNIPLYELDISCEQKLKDKSDIIIVYCQSGIRSKKAIKILKKKNFKNLYHLKEGLDGI